MIIRYRLDGRQKLARLGSTAIRNLRNMDYPSRTMAQLKEVILPVLNE